MRLLSIGLLAFFASPALLADSQRPATPQGIAASAQSANSIRLSWNEPWDNVGVAGYNIYRNGVYLSTSFNNEHMDNQVRDGNAYEYSVTAFDDARNYTVHSERTTVTLDATRSVSSNSSNSRSSNSTSGNSSSSTSSNSSGPVPPTGLNGSAQGNDSVRLSWSAAPGDILGYNIYRNGRYESTVKQTTEFTDSGLSRNEEYRYRVVSFTADARYSTKSEQITVRTGSDSSNDSSDDQDNTASQQASAQAAPQVRSDDNARSSSGVPAGYSLAFSDEFNGRSIDSSKWNSRYRWGPNWIINGEKQYYVDSLSNPDFGNSPFQFGNGALSITATRTPDNLKSSASYQPYLSGALTTYGKFRMQYGYVEMRARMPRGRGLWPAFWLLHQNENRNRPEIDVVEMLGQDPRKVFQTYHYYENSNLRSTPTYEASGPDYSAGFHTFGMKWEPGRITWYVDGQTTNTYSSGNVASEEMYLLVNLAVGGYWPGDPDGSTDFPARYAIDYIRAYRPN